MSPPLYGFLICGHKTHGKTYFGENVLPVCLMSKDPSLQNPLISMKYEIRGGIPQLQHVNRVVCLAFANSLKGEFCEENDITREELEENKEEYRAQLFKFAGSRRSEDNDYYTKKVAEYINLNEDLKTAVIISDFRQPCEYKYLTKNFPQTEWIVIRIQDLRKSIPQDDPMEDLLVDISPNVILTRKHI